MRRKAACLYVSSVLGLKIKTSFNVVQIAWQERVREWMKAPKMMKRLNSTIKALKM